MEGDFELQKENVIENYQKGSDIMKEEICEAIKCIKKGKAVVIDDVPAEFLKMAEGETPKKLVELCMKV